VKQDKFPKPFLKWAGGKKQLLPEILRRFPATFGRYYEPFLGGGAVYFSLRPKRATLNDVNEELINCYSVIRDDVEHLIRELASYPKCEKFFYQLRKKSLQDRIEQAARMIFLNRTCYNGLYRVNQSGGFNVPYGRYKNPTICHSDNLRAVSQILQKTRLLNDDIFKMQKTIKKEDLVYLDPPYHPVSKTANFRSYTKQGFDESKQIQLAELFATLAKRGAHVILSNSDTPFIRELYKDFHIETVYASRLINTRSDLRGTVKEVLVTTHCTPA
jgi:DNA adenine methylase